MGWVMSKVLGTLSFSSRGIPSSHFSLADCGVCPQDAAEYGLLAGHGPLSASENDTINKSSKLMGIITSTCSMQVW